MSTVSQFLAMAGGGSGGSLDSFREVYQNTDTPYAYTTGSPVILNLSTASTIYDLSTVLPGVPTIVHNTAVTNDIVRYTPDTTKIYDHYNGYTVCAATKDTLTTSTAATLLINNLTGAVFELVLPPTSSGLFLVAIIGADGFLYLLTCNDADGFIVATATGNDTNSIENVPLRCTIYSLSTGLQVGQVQASSGIVVGGNSASGGSTSSMYWSRPSAANTGYFVLGSSSFATDRASPVDNTYSSFVSAISLVKVNFNGASTATVTMAQSTAGGSGPGNGQATSGNAVVMQHAQTGGCQGGFFMSTYNYSYSSQSNTSGTTYLILDETRETATNTNGAVAITLPGSAVMLKDGSTLALVYKNSTTAFVACFGGDTQAVRSFTLTMANPALANNSAGNMDRAMQYGSYKNRFICGTGVYTMNATAKTLTFNKILYTIPGNNTLLQAPGCRSWEKAIYVSNSVSGEVTQLYTNGIDVNAVDPTIIATKSGSPAGFQSSEYNGRVVNTNAGFAIITGNVMHGGNTAGGDIITRYGVYGVVSGERLTRTWSGITSGSTVTAASDLRMTDRVPYLSGSNYVNATARGLLTGSAVRFDKVRFTVRTPAYTNTSTGASTILIRVLPNSNELKNIKIVNTPTQDVFVYSSTQIGIRVGPATNIVAEDIVIEADTILRFTGGGLLVDNTYAPLTGTVTLTLSNLAASSRLMSELFQ